MKLPVILDLAADDEFSCAAQWFHDQARLGDAFIDDVHLALERISEFPFRHAILERDVRVIHIRRFRFNVYFVAKDDHIQVLAILHSSRDPSVWRSRL